MTAICQACQSPLGSLAYCPQTGQPHHATTPGGPSGAGDDDFFGGGAAPTGSDDCFAVCGTAFIGEGGAAAPHSAAPKPKRRRTGPPHATLPQTGGGAPLVGIGKVGPLVLPLPSAVPAAVAAAQQQPRSPSPDLHRPALPACMWARPLPVPELPPAAAAAAAAAAADAPLPPAAPSLPPFGGAQQQQQGGSAVSPQYPRSQLPRVATPGAAPPALQAAQLPVVGVPGATGHVGQVGLPVPHEVLPGGGGGAAGGAVAPCEIADVLARAGGAVVCPELPDAGSVQPAAALPAHMHHAQMMRMMRLLEGDPSEAPTQEMVGGEAATATPTPTPPPPMPPHEAAARLRSAGLRTVSEVLACYADTSRALPPDTPRAAVRRHLLHAAAQRVPRRTTAAAMLSRTPPCLPTGCAQLDATLGGGLPFGQATELVGGPGSGKSHLLSLLAAAAVHRGHGVRCIDTGGCFPQPRLPQPAGSGGGTLTCARLRGGVSGLLPALLDACRGAQRHEVQVVLLDSLSACLLPHHQGAWGSADSRLLACVLQAVRALAAAGCCVVAAVQEHPTLPPVFASLFATSLLLAAGPDGGGGGGGRDPAASVATHIPLQVSVRRSPVAAVQTHRTSMPLAWVS